MSGSVTSNISKFKIINLRISNNKFLEYIGVAGKEYFPFNIANFPDSSNGVI